MKVESAGEANTFRVYSADGDGSYYLVDISANGGRGGCQCVDFGARCQPRIDRHEKHKDYPDPARTQCKHVHAVLLWLGKMVACRASGKNVQDVYGET